MTSSAAAWICSPGLASRLSPAAARNATSWYNGSRPSDRIATCLDDMLRGVEIRLANTHINDIKAPGSELLAVSEILRVVDSRMEAIRLRPCFNPHRASVRADCRLDRPLGIVHPLCASARDILGPVIPRGQVYRIQEIDPLACERLD